MFSLNEYDYTLPPQLIAQTPAQPADSCRLLIYDKKTKEIRNSIFNKLPELVDSSTLLIFNSSKVLKARIPLVFSDGQKTGEIFYLYAHDPYTFDALVRPGKKFPVGTMIAFHDGVSFTVEKITDEGRRIRCSHPIIEILEKYGEMPLPPYISYDDSKASPYQPIFAQQPGSVASPTASLHFTQPLLDQLANKKIETAFTVLHVGLGTFKQVDTQDITQYTIHSEQAEVDLHLFARIAQAKLNEKTILAVGTTVTRTLESLPYLWKQLSPQQRNLIGTLEEIAYRDQLTQNISETQAQEFVHHISYDQAVKKYTFSCQLYIYPGFTFRIIDELITNFHLPKSSLLMLVAGFVGYPEMKHIYEHAIEQKYRFYSFGDACRIRAKSPISS